MTLFERIYRRRYHDIGTIVAELETLRSMERPAFEAWQARKRWELASYLYEHNAFYRGRVGERFPQSWEALPVVTKQALQTEIGMLISRPFTLKELYVNNTSGSSGLPLTFAKEYYTQARVWAYKKLFSNLYGIDYFASKEAKFYGMPKSPAAWLVQKLKDAILRRERFVIFDLSDEVMERWIERFRKKDFDYIYGYTSAIVLFCRHLIKRGIVLNAICPTLKVVIVTSEVCSSEDKAIIRQACGVEARNEYGTADAGLIGYECPEGNIHLAEENVYVETNEANELLVTDLFNRAFPLVRYKIGDMAELSDAPCRCGYHGRVITSLQGRVNDVALLKSGKRIPGLTFYYISRALLESSGVLKEFIIRQTALDTFEFDVVSDAPLLASDIAELTKTAEAYLEPGLNIIVNQVETIERPASGKIKHFYSEIK